MTVKLLTVHHLEFLSLKGGGCTGLSESKLIKIFLQESEVAQWLGTCLWC